MAEAVATNGATHEPRSSAMADTPEAARGLAVRAVKGPTAALPTHAAQRAICATRKGQC
eukprot:gene19476-3236_t